VAVEFNCQRTHCIFLPAYCVFLRPIPASDFKEHSRGGEKINITKHRPFIRTLLLSCTSVKRLTEENICLFRSYRIVKYNKKFWKELICLLSLHYLNQNCASGSRNFIIFLYFIHLRRKLNTLQRYDNVQNYRILHRVVQRLSQHNLKISHHHHI
jgi:hypothetical protein